MHLLCVGSSSHWLFVVVREAGFRLVGMALHGTQSPAVSMLIKWFKNYTLKIMMCASLSARDGYIVLSALQAQAQTSFFKL